MISLYILSADPHDALLPARLLLFMLRCLFSPLTVSIPDLVLCSSRRVSPLSSLFDKSSQRTFISSLLFCPAIESRRILVQSNGCELLGSRYSPPTVTMRTRFIVGKMLLVSCIFKGGLSCWCPTHLVFSICISRYFSLWLLENVSHNPSVPLVL